MKSSQFRIKNTNAFINKFKKRNQSSADPTDNQQLKSPYPSVVHTEAKDQIYYEPEHYHGNTLDSMGQLIGQFKHFINNFEQLSKSTLIKQRDDVEVRDRHYLLTPPNGQSFQQKKQTIKRWFQKVVGDTISIAFNYYSNDNLTYQQTKIYCSQNILKNIANLSKRYHLKLQELKQIDEFLRDDIITYLQKKYPMTESTMINQALDKAAKAPDQSGKLINDFLNTGSLKFELRENENYDDIIKLMINEVMARTNGDSTIMKGFTNYGAFQKMMGKIFELVQDKEFMENGRSQSIPVFQQFIKKVQSEPDSQYISNVKLSNIFGSDLQSGKRQYRQKVKQYTNYLIGRKMPENVSNFCDEQINMKNVQIKNPAILRILTKWCQQLWQKFIPKNFYLNRKQDFKLQDGSIKSLSPEMRSNLDRLMQQQKVEIKAYMTKIVKQNYDIQIGLLNQLLESIDDLYLPENLQRVAGKFSVLIGKSLEKWVVRYLNRLIHGLLKVAHLMNQQHLKEWTSPLNLITFRIGDLLRCKCSSGQRQILKIFQQIKFISDNNPQIMKIVRIKNRLSQGTNDILINIRFGNLIVSEIQLAVNSKKNKFIKASNTLNHYLYQIQRSLFGPINQLCSIWRNLDPRSALYSSSIGQQLGQVSVDEHKCQKLNKSYQFQVFDSPFICTICKGTYSQNNLLLKHLKCSQCSYWKCGKCQIHLTVAKDLANMLLQDPKLKSICNKKFDKKYQNQEIPQFGIAIKMQDVNNKKPTVFKRLQIRGVNYLFTVENQQIILVCKLINQKVQKIFIDQHLIFELTDFDGNNLLDLSQLRVSQQYFLPVFVKDCYKEQKDSITLENQPLSYQNCSNIFKGSENERKNICQLNLSATKLNGICPINQLFPYLQKLSLNANSQLTQFSGLQTFVGLKTFQLTNNKNIKQFPPEIFQLNKLQILDLRNNQLTNLPTQIGSLKLLKQLNLSKSSQQIYRNMIRVLPQQLFTITTLQKLDISYQFVCQLSGSIGKLVNLNYLNVKHNYIQQLPDSINELNKLQFFDFSDNPIQKLPTKMGNLKKLHRLQLKLLGKIKMKLGDSTIYTSTIQQLPSDLQQITNLAIIDIHSQKINQLPSCKQCTQLEELTIQRCSIITMPNLSNCHKLRVLNIQQQMNVDQDNPMKLITEQFLQTITNVQYLNSSFNYMKSLPKTIGYLIKMKQLNLQYNQITQIPQEIGNCTQLVRLSLWKNQIKSLPNSFDKLSLLQRLSVGQNQLQYFPNLKQSTHLKQLYLHSNKISVIPESISWLVSLQTLNLQNNRIEVIPMQVQNLKRLKQGGGLLLRNNPIYFIHCPQFVTKAGCQHTKNIVNWIKNKQFTIQHLNGKINHFSNTIKLATHFQQINLRGHYFTDLPQEMGNLQNLKDIYLKQNKFELFPLSLCNSKCIKIIDISDNQLVGLPAEIGKLQTLTELYLSNNRINCLCQQLNNCKSLVNLDLQKNELSVLSPTIFMGLVQLKTITLTNNKLTQFPPGLLHCTNLEHLYFSQNYLQTIHGSFQTLINLKTLHLGWNKFRIFPDNITTCPNLINLSIQSCGMEEISDKIGELSQLQILNLNSNCIRTIPRTIGKLIKLVDLGLAVNKIQILVKELAQLKSVGLQRLNLFKNPLQTIQEGCLEWALQRANIPTKQIIKSIQTNQ